MFEPPALFRCDLPYYSRVVPDFEGLMAADHLDRCAQRLLIVPADYMSGTADLALIIEKVDPISDHACTRCRPRFRSTQTIALSLSGQGTAAVGSETT